MLGTYKLFLIYSVVNEKSVYIPTKHIKPFEFVQ